MRSIKTILIVVVLLVAVLAVVKLAFSPRRFVNRSSRTRVAIMALSDAVDFYEMETGHYPAQVEDLFANQSGSPYWHGPYIKERKTLLDSWLNEVTYSRLPHGYAIRSSGPDNVLGTGDDIEKIHK